MLRVTADIFSGRPNPTWILADSPTSDVLKDLGGVDRAAATLDSGFQGLGNRGLIVEFLGDHLAAAGGLPSTFRIAGGVNRNDADVAGKLIAMLTSESIAHPATKRDDYDLLDDKPSLQELKAYILETLPVHHPIVTSHDQSLQAGPPADAAATAGCSFETTAFNPGFWNDPAHITLNNCYAYGSNRRTDTFPQPGRASGHLYTALTCAAVAQAAVSDGANQGCAPDVEKPRWYMALVIAPGPAFKDYHWYRKQTEGYWGHKPGQTAARNTDNSGAVIYDPQTCNQGPYTNFCGYMYAQKKMVIR